MQNFGNGWVISSKILLGMWLFIQAGIKVKPCYWKGPLVSSSDVIWYVFINTVLLNTWRNNNVVITSKCRRFDVVTTWLLCYVSAGVSLDTMSPAVSSPANTLYFTWITSMQSCFCQISSRWTLPHWPLSRWMVATHVHFMKRRFTESYTRITVAFGYHII